MGPALADILDLYVLRRGEPEVAAWHDRLDRPVRWVHISEQADIASYLKGGGMLLMTGTGLSRDPAAQRCFIQELDDAGVAGGLIRLGAAFDELPAALADEAVRRDWPLVALHTTGERQRKIADALGDPARAELASSQKPRRGGGKASGTELARPRRRPSNRPRSSQPRRASDLADDGL